MKTIQNQQDIDTLGRAEAFSAPLIDHVEQYFCQLKNELGDSEDVHFALDLQHRIMLLEPSDDLRKVISLILGYEVPRIQTILFGVEYVEKHQLSDGNIAYKIAVMPDNECMTTLFMLAGTQEMETDAWLQSHCSLSVNELILQKLRATFERNVHCPSSSDSPDHVWVMAASAIRFDSYPNSEPFMPVSMTHDTDWTDFPTQPTHFVRVILRTTSAHGINPYVDGTDFCMIVDEQKQKAEFFWEGDCFEAAPKCEGSDIPSAMVWLKQMGEPLHLQLEDPFLTKEQRNLFPTAEANVSKAAPATLLPPEDFTGIF